MSDWGAFRTYLHAPHTTALVARTLPCDTVRCRAFLDFVECDEMTTLEWSPKMNTLFDEQVIEVVKRDRRTVWANNRLGHRFDDIRRTILATGLTDFREGYSDGVNPNLTPDDKALLYCFVTMRRHFHELCRSYRRLNDLQRLGQVFAPRQRPLIVDLGCGPATAALAIADTFPDIQMDYIAVDIAQSMLTKAERLFERAQAIRLVGDESTIQTVETWTVAEKIVRSLHLRQDAIVNASYLFANENLDVDEVVSLIEALVDCEHVASLYLLYTNSTDPRAREKYAKFEQQIRTILTGDRMPRWRTKPRTETIHFYQTRARQGIGRATFARQLICFRRG